MNYQSITFKKILPATCEEVFDAWLDPEGMSEWMRPRSVMDCKVFMEPRVGGVFRIIMRGPGEEIINTGIFQILDRPVKLQFTWISSRWKNQETLVTVEITQRASDCEIVITHNQFPLDLSAEQLLTGWNQILDKLFCRLTSSADMRNGPDHS